MRNREWGGGRTQISLRRHSRIGKPRGGGSVSELAERLRCAGGEIPARFGDILDAGETHNAHGEFAQGRHHMGTILGADLGEVLVESHVADMMVPVFNLPMATGQAQQIFGRGALWGQAGESEGVIIPNGALFAVDGGALDQESLSDMRKMEAGCLGGDDDFAMFKAAMSDLCGFSAEGKNRPKGGTSDGRGVCVDCL
ncbi:hypothetical protein [Acidithiobacillus thiooxidans]|uniref:hypothetical protein n=1 Tax=Acidithiobacillus thiooxidans TaxID=930 RepID=UPI001C06DC2B|nr:hypothetical protein [Acidithiobacillus thiooxidans]